MEGMELISFQLVTAAGAAKSTYVESVRLAKKGELERARERLKEGYELYTKGHEIHTELIQRMAGGEECNIDLLLLHAEDQMMSAEIVYLMAQEMIDLYQVVQK